MLEAITQKVDRSAVRHPNGEKVARSFADRPDKDVETTAGRYTIQRYYRTKVLAESRWRTRAQQGGSSTCRLQVP